MVSKGAMVAIGLAGIVAVGIWYFLFRKPAASSAPAQAAQTNPILTTLESGATQVVQAVKSTESTAENFVSTVNKGFQTVLTNLEQAPKSVGWGIRELGNTAGFIESHAASDVGSFIKGVQRMFSSGAMGFEKTVSRVGQAVSQEATQAVKTIEQSVRQAPKEITSGLETVGSDIEKGVGSFVSGIRSLFKGI